MINVEQSEFYKLKNCLYFDSPLFKQVISGDTNIFFKQMKIKNY